MVRTHYSLVTTDPDGNVYCISAQYHAANGRVQYDSFSTAC